MTLLSSPPPVQAAADWCFPAARQTQLDNGITVLAYHCPEQFVVSASMLFDVPLNAEPRDREGVAGMVARCMTQGAGDRSAEGFADALALCGADLQGAAFPDGLALRLAVPRTHLATALALMADSLSSPTFAVEEFEHERRLRLQEIEQSHAYPAHVAAEQLNSVLFDAARAGRPVGGTTASVGALSRDDVVEFARAHLSPSNATFIVAGDFTDVGLDGLVAASFAGWEHDGDPVVATEQASASRVPRLALVDWPNAPQSTLRVAGPAVTRGDDRWPALFVANFAVGGNFSARANRVLREQKGFTYGVSSSLDTSRVSGVLHISTAVRSDATAESLADIIAIVGNAKGTITDEEVVTGIRAATDSAALGFERADAVTGRVEMLVSQGLPRDHVDANLQRIREVTTAGVNAAYTDVVDPAAMTVVVVGDAATLQEPLAEWGYADVERREAPVS